MLLQRAENDLLACQRLADDDDIGDDVVGFHAQQAVEKSLKVALTLAGVGFPRTHDIDFLVARATEAHIDLPPAIEDSNWLTPWAAQLRYDEAPAPLDRAAAIRAAEMTVLWAHAALHTTDG